MDILDLVDVVPGENEDSDVDVEEIVGEGEEEYVGAGEVQAALERMVEENYKLMGTRAPVEPSPLVLQKLKEKYPQVGCTFYREHGSAPCLGRH